MVVIRQGSRDSGQTSVARHGAEHDSSHLMKIHVQASDSQRSSLQVTHRCREFLSKLLEKDPLWSLTAIPKTFRRPLAQVACKDPNSRCTAAEAQSFVHSAPLVEHGGSRIFMRRLLAIGGCPAVLRDPFHSRSLCRPVSLPDPPLPLAC